MSPLPHLLSVLALILSAAGIPVSQSGPTAKASGESAPVQRTGADGDPLPPGAIARLGGLRLQHGGGISNVLFTRDSKGLISAGGEAVIRLWDPATGKEIRHFTGHEAPVYSIALSPDGKVLASGGEDQTIRLWDVATGRALRHWFVTDDARLHVAFAPSGKVLASGGKGGSIVLWDPDTGKEIRQLKGRERQEERWERPDGGLFLFSLAFAPDGRHILAAQSEGLVLWDTNSGKRVRRYEGASQGGWSVGNGRMSVSSWDVNKTISFAADGQTFIVPGNHGPISLWELNSVEEHGRLSGHENVVLAARFAPDGKTLASAGFDGTLRVWDADSLKELHKIDTSRELVTDLAIAPDGKTVAIGTARGRMRVWDVKTGKEQAAGERSEPAVAIGFTPDGRSVVSLDSQTIRQWDAATGKERRKTALAEEKEAAQVRLSADRRLLVQARQGQPIRLLDATTGKEIRVLEGKHDQVFQLALAPDGKIVVAVTMNNEADGPVAMNSTIRVWDTATGKELQQLPARQVMPTALVISPDGRTIAAAEAGGGFRLWELTTGKERRRFAVPPRTRLNGEDWMEMRMAMRMRQFQRDEEGLERAVPLVFTPDGKGLAVSEGHTIRVWDLAGGKIGRRFACDAPVNGDFAFSPDGQWLAAGGPDSTIWLWNNTSTEVLARLKGHRAPIHRVAFSSDSKTLVSASEDGTAVVWDVRAALAASRSQPRAEPTEESLAPLWADLADADAARAYSAIHKLTDAPKPAVQLLRARLQPAPAADPQRVARLIDDLDDSEFAVREKATNELEQLHERIAPALDKALAANPPLEARRRLEALVQKIKQRQLPTDTVRALRAVEVLEAISTPDARSLLENLTKGAPEAMLTREAKAALERLAKRATK